MKLYDYLIVGSGLFGATFAHLAAKEGKRCLVIDKRPQLGGNIYCEEQHGINVHKYGAHIFHTSEYAVPLSACYGGRDVVQCWFNFILE